MSLGKQLREARQAKNLSIHQAYEYTRIHSNIISALENDEYEKVLSPTYAKSFLKEYASFLGLDTNKIIDEYNKLTSHDLQGHEYTASHNAQNRKSQALSFLSNNAPLIFKAVIVLLAALLVINGISKFSKSRAKSENKKQKAVKAKPVPQQKKNISENSSKLVSVPKGNKLILSINTTDDVWLKLKMDGKVIFENILKKGSTETWEAKDKFSIWTGKAHALELNLNGVYLGTAGKGVVKDLIIDRSGIRK